MKKLLMLACVFFTFLAVSAQNLDDIAKMINDQKWKEGKVAIDKFLADPKNQDKSDAWYFKARIYNALSYEKTVANDEAFILKGAAFDAFKKTQQLDPKDLRLKVEQYRPYLDVYYGYFDLGAKQFNEKNYNEAYQSFQRALEVKDFILSKNYDYADVKLQVLDTALVLNSGIAASLAKNDELAMTQYKKLIDANVAGPSYKEIYEAYVEYYYKKEDAANLDVALAKAKALYPENDYWTDVELDMVRKKGDRDALMLKYKELLDKNPNNFAVSYNYAVELFNSLYGRDPITKDVDQTKELLTNTLKNTIASDKGNDANMLMANHLYNMAADISADMTRLKGTSPEAAKKRSELNSQYNKKMDEFIVYGNKAIEWYDKQPTLKPVQKSIYKGLLSNLSEVYTVKKDTKKAAEMDAKKTALDKM